MRIYEISERSDIRNIARLNNLPSRLDVYGKEAIFATFHYQGYETVVDYMEQSVPFVSDRMKSLLQEHSKYMICRPVYGENKDTRHIYWLIQPKPLLALHESSRVGSTGSVEEVVLNQELVKYYPFFSVAGLSLKRWFVHMEVAETLLRYQMTGFSLKEVQVR